MGCAASRCGGARCGACACRGRKKVAPASYAAEPEEWPPAEVKRKVEKMLARIMGDLSRAAFAGWASLTLEEGKRREDARFAVLKRLQQRALSGALHGWHDRASEQARLKRVADKAMRRLQTGKMGAAFERWAEHIAQIVGARRMLARLLKGVLYNCWEGWMEFHKEAKEEKQAAAAAIQARRRGQMARRARMEQKNALIKMQGLAKAREARDAASGIAARAKALAEGGIKDKPSALNDLLTDIVGLTAVAVQPGPPRLKVSRGPPRSTSASLDVQRLGKALLPHAPLTDAELEMVGVSSKSSRAALLQLCGAQALAPKRRRKPKSERSDRPRTPPTGVVRAKVVSARGLKKMDTFGSADPFVVLRCGREEHKTEHINNTREPTWNAEFTFETVEPNATLFAKVFDHDKGSKNDPMGQLVFTVDEILSVTGTRPMWRKLRPMEGCPEPEGELLLGVAADFPEPEPEPESSESESEEEREAATAAPKKAFSFGARLRAVGDQGAKLRRQRDLLAAVSAVAALGHNSVAYSVAEKHEERLHAGYDLDREAGHGGSNFGGATSFHAGGAQGAEVYTSILHAAHVKAGAKKGGRRAPQAQRRRRSPPRPRRKVELHASPRGRRRRASPNRH